MTGYWKPWAAPFLGGLILGALLSLGVVRHFHRPFRNDEQHRKHMLEHFSRKLDLTPEQKKKVGDIFEANGQKMRALWDETRPKFAGLRDATNAEIRALLTPDQQKKFDVFQKKMEARWKRLDDERAS